LDQFYIASLRVFDCRRKTVLGSEVERAVAAGVDAKLDVWMGMN
jgi:hypothetical protein